MCKHIARTGAALLAPHRLGDIAAAGVAAVFGSAAPHAAASRHLRRAPDYCSAGSSAGSSA